MTVRELITKCQRSGATIILDGCETHKTPLDVENGDVETILNAQVSKFTPTVEAELFIWARSREGAGTKHGSSCRLSGN
jgi:hypothetical protein